MAEPPPENPRARVGGLQCALRGVVVLLVGVGAAACGALYLADARRGGALADSAAEHEVSGEGAHDHIASKDALVSEAHHRHGGVLDNTQLDDLERLGFTADQIEGFKDLSAEQLVHTLDEASAVIEKHVLLYERDGVALPDFIGAAPEAAEPERGAPAEPEEEAAGNEEEPPAPEEMAEPAKEPEDESPAPAGASAGPAAAVDRGAPKTLSEIDLTKPPEFCFTAVNGEPAFPAKSNAKWFPGPAAAKKIAAVISATHERNCWVLTKRCGRYAKGNNGKPFINRFLSAKNQVPPVDGSTDEQYAAALDMLPNEIDGGGLGTCALVGNADNLVGKKWGKQIDAHDFVVRFNVKQKGHEEDVGYKTHGLWVKPNYYLSPKLRGMQEPTKYYVFPKDAPQDFAKEKGKRHIVYGNSLSVWRQNARELYTIYKKDKKITRTSQPTGGWARMMAFVESGICSRVDVYGYSSGGGKYFSAKDVVKDAHTIQVEHYVRRLIMGLQAPSHTPTCIYGE